MKKHLVAVLGISFLSICLASCGWKPKVTAVPIGAPWSAMKLPVKENAVVWKSEPNEFRAVHKEDKRAILKDYTDALKTQGWGLEKLDQSGDRFTMNMKNGAESLQLEVYDFDNTGVVIKTGAKINESPYYPANTKTSAEPNNKNADMSLETFDTPKKKRIST